MTQDPSVFFRALSDATRLRCLVLVAEERELCVCELTDALGLSQPKISRHLAYLRDAGVVNVRRRGLWVFYRLREEMPEWCHRVLRETVAGVRDQEPHAGDLARLIKVAERGERVCTA